MWNEYKSTLNERYHNAAVSLAFVLKTSVFVNRDSKLDDRRASAFRDFLELVDWATPQQWHVRTGLVQTLLQNMGDVTSDRGILIDMMKQHQSLPIEGGVWGDIAVSAKRKRRPVYGLGGDVPKGEAPLDVDDVFLRNSQWTEACTHHQRGMGFTCGLWDLLHILTIGASLQVHQLYGFHSGYLTAPQHVAEVIKRFIANFLACDVCRWNFLNMFENCGHDHCRRLSPVMPRSH